MTKVIHIRNAPNDWQNNSNYVYIGRPSKDGNGYFGNSHVIGWCNLCYKEHDRMECIAAFKQDHEARVQTDSAYKEKVMGLKDKTLVCFCAPQACHGNVYQKWISSHNAE